MRLIVLLFITLHSTLLLAQQNYTDYNLTPKESIINPLKHNYSDSIKYAKPQLDLKPKRTRNRTVNNMAMKYTLDNLRLNREDYQDYYSHIYPIREYAENEYLRNSVNYIRKYMATLPSKERSLELLKEKIKQDSIQFFEKYPDADSSDIEVDNNILALVTFMENDENYKWLIEKGRDSVLITILSASNQPKDIWLNNNKVQFYRFMSENIIGDSIGTWIQTLPGNKIKFLLDENVYQRRRITRVAELEDEESLLEIPDSLRPRLKEMKIGKLKRTYWTYYTDVAVSLGQGHISDSWAAGGESSFSMLADLKYFATYKKNNLVWDNSVRYRLGALKSGSEKLSKNEDKFEIQSKAGLKAFRYWNYAAQFDMNTVLFNSYNNPAHEERVASLLSPGYFILSLGFDYKPNNNLSLYLSPIAGQWIYMSDTTHINPARYGLEPGKKSKSDTGAKIELNENHNLFSFLKLTNRVIVFASYNDKPKYITFDWRLNLDFKINYYLQTSIYMNTVYDKRHSGRIQLKETLGLGINFRF